MRLIGANQPLWRRLNHAILATMIGVALVATTSAEGRMQQGRKVQLEHAPSPVDNPLKGLVPYMGARPDTAFPHSLEWTYIPLSDLVIGPDRYDWSVLEKALDEVASRGRQLVFRVYLEYPNGRPGVPRHLLDSGLKMRRVTQEQYPELYAPALESPDYSDPRLVRTLVSFVREFGRRYDGDPRIGFITAGLLGYWGEWHNYPANELWAPKSTQIAVMEAYERAFRTTPILLRYPAGPNHPTHAANAHRPFGYHDDSFAWSTIDQGRPNDRWNFQPQMIQQGAADRWKTHPIGGEIRPEIWGVVFDEPRPPRVQDFAECVRQTRVTWLMDSGMFSRNTVAGSDRWNRALELVRAMGYDFHVSSVEINPLTLGRVQVRSQVVNQGVAPFYYNWPVEYGLIDQAGQVVRVVEVKTDLRKLLPDQPPTVWSATLSTTGLPAGEYILALRVRNPLPTGRPIRFANRTQDAHVSGWLSLTTLRP